MKKFKAFLLASFALVCVSGASAGSISASTNTQTAPVKTNNIKKYYQHANVIHPEQVPTTENNFNDFLNHPNQTYWQSNGYNGNLGNNSLQSNQETLSASSLGGNPDSPFSNNVNFTSSAYLPTSFDNGIGYVAPQAVAVSRDGNTAWVMGHFTGNQDSNSGQIIKYNLGDLQNRFHTNQNGSMQLIRQAEQWNKTGRPVPQAVTSSQNSLNSAKKAAKRYRKAKYHSRKYCKKHHMRYRSRKSIKRSNRRLRTKKNRRAAKRANKRVNKAQNNFNNQQNNWNNQQNVYNGVLGDIQVGQPFATGHGQALAFNPTNGGSLWYMNYEKDVGQNQYMAKIDPNTLTPQSENYLVAQGNQKNGQLGHSFTFDDQGNAWTWVYKPGYDRCVHNTGSNKQVGIYEAKAGDITQNNVKFVEKADLQNGPGTWQQTCGFNPRNGRFFLASDSSFISVPTAKVENGSLDPSDVQTFQMPTNDLGNGEHNGGRETEGLAFDQNGLSYFLTDQGPEIFTSWDLNNN